MVRIQLLFSIVWTANDSKDTEINKDGVEQTQLEEIEVDEHDDEAEYVGPKGSDTDEDPPEDTSDTSDTEEANGFMSGECWNVYGSYNII